MGIIVALVAAAGREQSGKASKTGFQGLAGKHVLVWVLTFPGAALIGATGYAFAHYAIQPFIH